MRAARGCVGALALYALAIYISFSSFFSIAGVAASADKDKGHVLKADLPHIACQVCKIVVNELRLQVEDKRATAPYRKITELDVFDVMEKVCDPKTKGGVWAAEYDIVQEGSYLNIEHQSGKSKCEHECLTLAKSCNDLLDEEIDADDLSAALWRGNLPLERLQQRVCHEWTERCEASPKKVKSRKDYPFVVMDEKELQMEELMASMEAAGMGGSMFSREDMMRKMDEYGTGDGYGDGYGMGTGGYGMGMGMGEDMDEGDDGLDAGFEGDEF